MTIKIKTKDEIQKMRVAGKLAAEVLEMIAPHVIAGVTTGHLNQLMHDYMINEQDTHSRHAKLSWFSRVQLHLHQPSGMPRHS